MQKFVLMYCQIVQFKNFIIVYKLVVGVVFSFVPSHCIWTCGLKYISLRKVTVSLLIAYKTETFILGQVSKK
jgi:hypothetical protein